MLRHAEEGECLDVRLVRLATRQDVKGIEEARRLHARQLRTTLALHRVLKVLGGGGDDGGIPTPLARH